MRIIQTIIVSLIVCSSTLHAGDESSIAFSSVSEALEKLKQNSSAHINKQDGWTIISLVRDGNNVLWFFAPDEHDAHPAMMKKTILERNGKIEIVTVTLCEAEKKKCEALVTEFKNLNKQWK